MVHMAEISPVELLRRQYLQLVDPKYLALPEQKFLRLPQVQDQIYASLFSAANVRYEPPERYKFRVLKRIITALEDAVEDPDEDEISDELSSLLAHYMSQPLPAAIAAAQQKSYVTYTAPVPDQHASQVTTVEAPSLLASSGTTGFRTWEGALHLGSFLCSQIGKDYVSGKSVLELGAGTGFLSILCAKHLGARHVLATDGSHEVVIDLKANIQLNDLVGEGGNVDVAMLQWGHALLGGPADMTNVGVSIDLIIGADVTYDLESMPALVATLRDLFEMHSRAKALVSATVRNEDTLACFLEACDANHFHIQKLEYLHPSFELQTGFFIINSTRIEVFEIVGPEKPQDAFAV